MSLYIAFLAYDYFVSMKAPLEDTDDEVTTRMPSLPLSLAPGYETFSIKSDTEVMMEHARSIIWDVWDVWDDGDQGTSKKPGDDDYDDELEAAEKRVKDYVQEL